jgi:hypothetical protein
MVDFINKEFLEFYLGSKDIRSHIDAVHAARPGSDQFTGDIVEGVVNNINCSGIISLVSRRKADLNRPRTRENKEAIDEYRQIINGILDHLGIINEEGMLTRPYLHLAIHGMKKTRKGDVEIGTLSCKICSPEVKDWLIEEIESKFKIVFLDKRFPGDPSKSVHRWGDKTSDLSYLGYGHNYNVFQLEISRTYRKYKQRELINIFSEIIIRFNNRWK